MSWSLELHDPALVDDRRDPADASPHGLLAEACDEGIHVLHAVEHRQDHGVRPDRRREIVERLCEREAFHRQEHRVVGPADPARRHQAGLQGEVAMGTDDPQTVLAQLLRASGPHQERHVAPGLGEPAPEISTGRTGSDDEHAHGP
jgi:hypothetical protein